MGNRTKSSIHIDRFSAGLDDLTRKEQGDHEKVLEVLRHQKRFSVFEATENKTIAATLTYLCQSGRVKTDHETIGYPWTAVVEIDGKPI